MSDAKTNDSEILADGQQVITACALIHKKVDGIVKVFLPRRATTKKFLPGVFEIPGGHIDFGENLVEGLKREIREEIGMEISVGDPFAAFAYVNDIKRSHSVEIVYFAQFTNPIYDIKLDPNDHSEYIWVSKDTISDAYTEKKGVQDDEFKVLARGLDLLDGGSLKIS